MSILQNAFENAPIITASDMPDNTPLASSQSKVMYSNHDERSSVEQMPIYIREGDVRYSTTAIRPEGGDTFYFGGGGGDAGACPDYTYDANSNNPAQGYLYFIEQVIDTGYDIEMVLATARFENGCLQWINPGSSVLQFEKKDITSCGGTSHPFISFPIQASGGVEDYGWES